MSKKRLLSDKTRENVYAKLESDRNFQINIVISIKTKFKCFLLKLSTKYLIRTKYIYTLSKMAWSENAFALQNRLTFRIPRETIFFFFFVVISIEYSTPSSNIIAISCQHFKFINQIYFINVFFAKTQQNQVEKRNFINKKYIYIHK